MISSKVIGVSETIRSLKQLDKDTAIKIKQETFKSASRVLADAKQTVPVAYGRLRSSGRIEDKGKTINVAFGGDNSSGYAYYVEFGRRPGKWPPKQPIEDWVKKRGLASTEKDIKGVAFVIRRKIGKKGTRPQPFLRPAFERERPRFKAAMRKII